MFIRPLLIAIQFLTRFPVKLNQAPDEQEMGHAVLYFPIAGLLIGLVLWLVFKFTAEIHAPQWLSAALVLTAWILSTGGLHLDGLADSVDAWAGGRGDRERILSIMKDPTCGAMAVIALFLVLILKVTALGYLPSNNQASLIVTVPVLARSALPLLFLTTPYVRPAGLGAAMVTHLPRQLAIAVVVVIFTGVVIFYGRHGVLAVIVGLLVYSVLRKKMLSTLGGATGDTAGALVEISETVILLFFAFSNGVWKI